MSQRTTLEHPRFGFSPILLINESVNDGALTGTSTIRAAGLRTVGVQGTLTLLVGVGTVKLIIEGSNDNANWFGISESPASDLFDTGGQVKLLNSNGNGLVDLEHWHWIRVRASIESGAPTFSLTIVVAGIARDSESFRFAETFSRAGAVPTSQTGTEWARPAGTMLSNYQVTASGVVTGGAGSFEVELQGTFDGGITWNTLGTISVGGNGSQILQVDSERFFSFGAYANFRTRVVDGGGPAGGATAFTIDVAPTLDSADWTSDETEDTGGGGSMDPSEVFIQAVFGAPSAEVGNVITVLVQLLKADGSPLQESRKIGAIVYDAFDAGDLDLAANATFSAIAGGFAFAGIATNRLIFVTDVDGTATLSITDVAVETVYVTAVNPAANQAQAQLLVEAAQAVLVFA